MLGWLAVAVCGALTAVTPMAQWSVLRLPPIVATPTVTLGMVLAVWYFDLAPRVVWNAHGVAVRTGWQVVATRWSGVGSVRLARSTIAGDRLILQVVGRRFDVGLDRLWWLAWLSSRYARRNHRLFEQIQLVRGQAAGAVSDGQPPSLRRFIPLAAALACWSGGLFGSHR